MMMERLKNVVDNKKTFNVIVKATIGQKTDPISIQQTVARYTGERLTETTKDEGAELLRIRFRKMSEEGEKKILVILDDIWEMVNLKDIGLSTLPKGLKLLLTSRDEKVCKQIAREANSGFEVIKLDVLEEPEALNFFYRCAGLSEESDPDLLEIGGHIVRKCGRLPLAIKLIATALNSEEKSTWSDALLRLENNDLNLDDRVLEIIKISYDYLKEEETKAIFLLCGLFPEDFDIPIEELTRYAWGMQLLNAVPTLRAARNRTKFRVNHLKYANLLIASDRPQCVKMHDLVLAFALNVVSKGEHPWIVNHGNMSKLSAIKMRHCKRISLTCTGLSELPGDFKYPNLSFLKLMHGSESLTFPENFYERMENIAVIAFEEMKYPFLPESLQYSTNLRTLCLHSCLLMSELSQIGNLTNLEILSFAHCSIRKLPSTIRNLKQLKLLDLRGCVDLKVDDGVLGNLVDLEELYMSVANKNAIRFTDKNCTELEKLSSNLFALEVELFENNVKPKNMVFKDLERFRISMGCYLKGKDKDIHSFENTLMLVTNRDELLDSKINELFRKTEVLHLTVDGMNDLEDVSMESLHDLRHTLHNLRVLNVSGCANLTCLFSLPLVKGLSKLECLTITECPILEEVVHVENNGAEVIRFQKLKILALSDLPNLLSFCRNVDVIELPELAEMELGGLPNFTSVYPKNKLATACVSSDISTTQSLFDKEVFIPKLEILEIERMERLKEIWPNNEEAYICGLRKIEVIACHSLVNLFPSNPMRLVHNLEWLHVRSCGSIEVIFNLDFGCINEIGERGSSLGGIRLLDLRNLKEVWRMKGVNNSHHIIHDFQAVTHIGIEGCARFRNLFTPTTANFDLSAIERLVVLECESWREIGKHNELGESGTSINTTTGYHQFQGFSIGSPLEVDHNIPHQSHLLPILHHLRELCLAVNRAEVLFEIESTSCSMGEIVATHNNQQLPPLSQLKLLWLEGMHRMSHVWKCNWNKFLFPQLPQQPQSSFLNLEAITLFGCGNIKYLFSPLMAKLFYNLKTIHISWCDGMEEVVSNRDDENEEMATSISTHTNTAFFPRLDTLNLAGLDCLMRIGGGGGGVNNAVTSSITAASIHEPFQHAHVDVVPWSLCQYSRKIYISDCNKLSSVIPLHAAGQLKRIEELEVGDCNSITELFEAEEFNNDVGEGSGATEIAVRIPRLTNMTLVHLPKLKNLTISGCNHLGHIFTFSTLESLKQLNKLEIKKCNTMEVIVKEEDGDHTTRRSEVVEFPRLHSVTLSNLPNLKGFFLGMNDFQCLLLDMVNIDGCPQMMVFTSGRLTAPKLNYIHTDFGKHSLECGLNVHLTTTHVPKPSTYNERLDCTLGGIPHPFSNLIEVNVQGSYVNSKHVIPSNALLQLQKLEKINVKRLDTLEEVFEALNEAQDCVIIPKLREVNLEGLDSLKYIWKSNQWKVLEFPSLTSLSINSCSPLEHVFTYSMVGSLLQLQELQIRECNRIEVIVKEEEDSETRMKEIMFPCLKSIKLDHLPKLMGFCLGKEAFTWPSLDTLEIKKCPQITVFTSGQSTTPKLKIINTSFGRYYAKEDPNSFINNKKQEELSF